MVHPRCPLRPAVFLDRDDTLIVNSALPQETFAGGVLGDLADPASVKLISGAAQACLSLWQAGFVLIVVTNQGVVARGGAPLEQVHATNKTLCQRLPKPISDTDSGTQADQCSDACTSTDESAFVTVPACDSLIERVYFCPFHPAGSIEPFAREHPWRKPLPGMILAAAEDCGLDLAASWLVGDSERDVLSGIAAGLDPARVLQIGAGGAYADLARASAHILGVYA